MRNPLKVVRADDAPDTLIDAWTLTMQAQGLSHSTITERTRLIRQLARTTGTDPAALTPHTLTVFLANIDSPVTADAYYSIARAWCTWLVRAGHRDDEGSRVGPHVQEVRDAPGALAGRCDVVLQQSRQRPVDDVDLRQIDRVAQAAQALQVRLRQRQGSGRGQRAPLVAAELYVRRR